VNNFLSKTLSGSSSKPPFLGVVVDIPELARTYIIGAEIRTFGKLLEIKDRVSRIILGRNRPMWPRGPISKGFDYGFPGR